MNDNFTGLSVSHGWPKGNFKLSRREIRTRIELADKNRENIEQISTKAITQELKTHGVFIWAEPVTGVSGYRMVAICDDSYEPESAYERARKKNDPLFAPHGHFATLKPDSILQAVEFVKEFGPLEERGMPKSFEDLSTSRLCYVDLDEFGVRQFEFDCVCRLWCARNSTELMTAWRGIHERAVQLQRSIDTIGKNYDDEDPEVILGENLDFLRSADIPFPFRHSSNFETWLKDRPSSKLRPETMDWISEELNRHSGETRLTWDYHQAGDDYRFRTRPRASSLWQIIWTFFGLDISDRGLWRICPHCQQMFYPKRRDQFYCTPRQQALASKREWWHKNKKRAK